METRRKLNCYDTRRPSPNTVTCSVVWQYSFKSKRQVLQAVRLLRSNFRPNWRYLWRDYSKNLSAWHVSFLSSTSDTKLDDVLEMIYMALSAFSAQHVWDHIRNKNWSVRVTKSEKCNAAVKTYTRIEMLNEVDKYLLFICGSLLLTNGNEKLNIFLSATNFPLPDNEKLSLLESY